MPQLKLFVLGRRRPGISAEEFHDHWRHPHGTWGRQMPILRGYVQSHQIDTELLGAAQSHFDCVAEMWLDELEDLEGFTRDPVFTQFLVPDAPQFLAPEPALSIAVKEELLCPPNPGATGPADDLWSPMNRPISIKLLQFAGSDAWARSDDADLGRRIGALRHVRGHLLESSPSQASPYRGVRELWWPTFTAFRAGVAASPSAFAELLARAGQGTTLLAQAERFF